MECLANIKLAAQVHSPLTEHEVTKTVSTIQLEFEMPAAHRNQAFACVSGREHMFLYVFHALSVLHRFVTTYEAPSRKSKKDEKNITREEAETRLLGE